MAEAGDLRRQRLAVWAVATGSAALQVVFFSLRRPPSWDEAIYLSQVTRGVPALPFVASRARGITVLVAPLTSVGAPLWLVRLFLVVASAVVLAATFRLWVPLLGWGAPLGALVFASSWPAMFYGSEVMPNLWVAFACVACLGFVGRSLVAGTATRRPGDLAGAGLCAFACALIRPPDAAVLSIAVFASLLVVDREAWRVGAAITVGAVAGSFPWLVEMSVRFGGPFEALRAARGLAHVRAGGGLSAHLALTDGPLLGPDRAAGVPWIGVAWWTGLTVLTVLACLGPRSGRDRTVLRVAAVTAAALVLEYVALVAGLAPRFLLPALAVLSLTAGAGLARLPRLPDGTAWGRVATISAAVALAIWVPWQLVTADRLERTATSDRADARAAGEAIARAVGDEPCRVASTVDYPQVAFAARCSGRVATGTDLDGPPVGVLPVTVVVTREMPLRTGEPVRGLPRGWFAAAG